MALLEATHPPGSPATAAAGELTLVEHLVELRRRLLICLTAVTLTTVAAWFAYDHAVAFMIGPYRHYLAHHPKADISHGDLVTTGPLEGFTTRLKISVYLGAVLAAPVWLWQLWRFVAPGLYKKERRYAGAFTASAVALFALGAGTAVLVFPRAVAWMISVSGTDIAPMFSPARYFSLYSLACLVFGAVFTYPVFLVALELVRVVTSTKLRAWRRYAIVALCAVAAVITPSSDPFSFLAMALPMVVFYEVSILVGRALHR